MILKIKKLPGINTNHAYNAVNFRQTANNRAKG